MRLRAPQAWLASASDHVRKRPVTPFPAVHESARGALRQFVATHQIGRYRTQSGHIESGLTSAVAEAIAVRV